MSKIELHTAISFLDGILSVDSIPDAPRALNGLQLENGGSVSKVAAAVDGSEKAIHAALETGADLLLLHHGIFWQPMQPITGIAYRKLKAAMDGNLAIYAAHLPLDVHPAYGNNALLAKACGLRPCYLSLRMKNREVDLLIVVNMFLTGFDATTLNTLWVDKNLRYHGLLQAYSRTDRKSVV